MSFIYDLADTWNSGATTFTAIKMNVTDTASNAASMLMDLQVGGASRFKILKTGGIAITGPAGSQFLNITDAFGSIVIQNAVIGCSGGITSSSYMLAPRYSVGVNFDTFIERDSAYNTAIRNDANAQTLRIYGTFTDASNYVRASLAATSTSVTLAAQSAGTGAANLNLDLVPRGTGTLRIGNSSGAVITSLASGLNDIEFNGGAGNISLLVSGLSGNVSFGGGRVGLGNSHIVSWHNNTDGRGSGDAGISRASSGVLQIGDSGTTSNANGGLLLARITASSFVRTTALTVATLPSASTSGAGARAYVTDSNATLAAGHGNTVAGGGANSVPVISNGTNWIIG